MSTTTTVIENGKIKWTLFDSKHNKYNWEISIKTYESYIQLSTYPKQTIQYSDGRSETIGEFSYYVVKFFTNVIDDIYENSCNDTDFIFEVWHIVSSMTVYSSDIGEYPRYAIETLVRGGGDCEDTVILMADMLKSSKHTKNWKIQMVYFDSENPTNPKHVNHVALAVDTGTSRGILETTSKNISDLNAWSINSVVGWYSDV